MSASAVTLVVPCYNEGERIDEEQFLSLLDGVAGLKLLFVDDGSRDNTAVRLAALSAKVAGGRVRTLNLSENQGKAEAVRRGLIQALAEGAPITGYLDADLATPVAEVRRLVALFRAGQAGVLLASRVSLLGREIRRRAGRHYLGRVFASVASLVLGLTVYDTQCGTKLFRRHPALHAALDERFLSRWIFDVELLGRMIIGAPGVAALPVAEIVEEPLLVWRDVAGSKLRPAHAAGAATDIARVALDFRRRRRAVGG